LGGAAIVGDEPLQKKAWPYTLEFLKCAQDLDVPIAAITNGYELANYIAELRAFSRIKLLVSLDGVGARHDAIRRKEGAYAEIAKGIAAAANSSELRERLAIGTILLPNNLAFVHEIISFAGAQGIGSIALSPLLIASGSAPLRVHPKVMAEACKRIPDLKCLADNLGVNLYLTDEITTLGEWNAALRAAGLEVMVPRRRPLLIRVDAEGGVETYDTIRLGTSTGLRLPPNPDQVAEFADEIVVRTCQPDLIAA
jgi:hypothetical protein